MDYKRKKRQTKANGEGKTRLLGSMFPEIIEFDGIKCRTPRINQAAALCLNADKAFRGNEKGTIHENIELISVFQSSDLGVNLNFESHFHLQAKNTITKVKWNFSTTHESIFILCFIMFFFQLRIWES